MDPSENESTFIELVENLSYLTGTYCTSTLADSETKTFVKCNWSNKFNVDLNVITRHNHFNASWESNLTSYIEGTDEELRTIFVVERSVTTTLFFLQHIDLSEEVSVRSDRTRFSDNLTTSNILLVDTTEKKTYVITSLSLIKEFTEHLDTCYDCLLRLVAETNDFCRIVNVDSTCLNTSCNNSTTTSDREDVLDRHKEWFLVLTNRKRNICINSVHKFHYLLFPLRLSVKSTKS